MMTSIDRRWVLGEWRRSTRILTPHRARVQFATDAEPNSRRNVLEPVRGAEALMELAMKRVPLILGVAAAALLAGNTASIFPSTPFSMVTQAEAAVSVSIFFEPLSRHGRWVSDDRYGYVWVPVGVGPRWAPYTHGHWVYTDRYGWYFASDDPYAWAVYHYGRWDHAEDIGWYWVPGTKWAPAWVSWRRGHDHIGWAPLPPRGRGYAVSVDVGDVEISADFWHFVPTRRFLEPNLSLVIDFGGHDRYYRDTRPVGSVIVQNNIVINNVIDIDYVEKEANTKVVVYKVEKVEDPQQQTASVEESGTIKAFQPEIADVKTDEKPAKIADKEEVKAEKQASRTNDDAEAKTEGQAKADADAKAKTDGQAKADADAKTKTEGQAKVDADAKAKTEGQAKADADAKAKTKGQAKVDADSKAKTDGQAKVDADAKTKTKGQAKVDAKAKTETQTKVDDNAKVKTEGKASADTRTDGMARSGEVKTDGQARSGEVKTDGKTRSDQAKSAEDPRRDGQARSGEVKRDGQAKAGEQKKSGVEADVKVQPKPEKRSDSGQTQSQDAAAKAQDRVPDNAGGDDRQAKKDDEKKKQKVN